MPLQSLLSSSPRAPRVLSRRTVNPAAASAAAVVAAASSTDIAIYHHQDHRGPAHSVYAVDGGDDEDEDEDVEDAATAEILDHQELGLARGFGPGPVVESYSPPPVHTGAEVLRDRVVRLCKPQLLSFEPRIERRLL